MAEQSRSEELSGQTQANESEPRAESRDEKSIYEVGFHVVPTLSEQEVSVVVERLHVALQKAEATVIIEGAPKKMQFAYRIERSAKGKREKYTEGYFGWIKFEAETKVVETLEQMLRESQDILRFLLIHTTRESTSSAPRAVFSSDRLEGETIAKPIALAEEKVEVSEEELEKSLEALMG